MKVIESLRFRLYVTGNAPNSLLALANLRALCEKHLADRHDVEVIDLAIQPERALSDGVYMTPTLIKVAPAPEVRIIGSLSDLAPILTSLGLQSA